MRPPTWQSQYESCYYLIDFNTDMVRDNSTIGLVITSMENTAVYLFEGDRKKPVYMGRA